MATEHFYVSAVKKGLISVEEAIKEGWITKKTAIKEGLLGNDGKEQKISKELVNSKQKVSKGLVGIKTDGEKTKDRKELVKSKQKVSKELVKGKKKRKGYPVYAPYSFIEQVRLLDASPRELLDWCVIELKNRRLSKV